MSCDRPTHVSIFDSARILIEIGNHDDAEVWKSIGFKESIVHESVYGFRSAESAEIYKMAEKLRDMGVPFASDWNGGADYAVETFRNRGLLSGRFERIILLRNEINSNCYSVEEI